MTNISRNQLSDSGWKSFWLCMVFTIVLPLTPLLVELLNTHTITTASLAFAGAMLLISIAASAQDLFQLIMTLLAGFLSAVMYGFVDNDQFNTMILIVLCGSILLWHIIERYYRHVRKEQKFLELKNFNI